MGKKVFENNKVIQYNYSNGGSFSLYGQAPHCSHGYNRVVIEYRAKNPRRII